MGFSIFHSPDYLQQTPTGLFLFRLRVPKGCIPIIGKGELKYSLKTKSLIEARNCVSAILSLLKDIFNSIRLGYHSSQTETHINQIIKDGITKARLLELSPALSIFTTHPGSNHTNTPEPPMSVSSEHHDQLPPLGSNTPFTVLREAFFKEKELSDGWRFKTMEDHGLVFSLFVEIFGDVPVESIDKVLMRKTGCRNNGS